MIEKLIIGTYSREKAQGIYSADFDSDRGTIGHVSLAADAGSPTYLALSKANTLYAIHQGKNQGGLRVFTTQSKPFTKIDEQLLFGPSPVYVMVDDDRKLVVTCNYRDGTATIYHIKSGGGLQRTDSFHHEGHGVLPQQQGPHVHYATFTPGGLLAIVDLGTDEILLFEVDKSGQFTQLVTTLKMRSGFGPKKIIFMDDKAYVLGELASQVAVLDYDAIEHVFQQRQLISTIADSWLNSNGCGGMHFSNDGRFLYVSNRGENSIAVFNRNVADGSLIKIQTISGGGDFPREFCLDKTQRYLIVGNHRSNNIVVFSRDEKTGKLKARSKSDAVPEAVCFVID